MQYTKRCLNGSTAHGYTRRREGQPPQDRERVDRRRLARRPPLAGVELEALELAGVDQEVEQPVRRARVLHLPPRTLRVKTLQHFSGFDVKPSNQ